jgi:hypothetical protein
VSPKGGTSEGLLARIPSPGFGGAKQRTALETTPAHTEGTTAPAQTGEPTTPAHTEGTRSLQEFTSDTASTTITSFPLGVLLVCLFDFRLGFTVIQPSEATLGACLVITIVVSEEASGVP